MDIANWWKITDIFHGRGQKAREEKLSISFGSFKPKDLWTEENASKRRKSDIFERFV